MPVEDEIKLLEKTVVCRDLSTSLSTETEDEELKMLRNTKPPWLWRMKTSVHNEYTGYTLKHILLRHM